MEYAFVCGGSAGELCLSCAAPIVIETSVMNKTCDPVSIRVQGFDPEFRVPGPPNPCPMTAQMDNYFPAQNILQHFSSLTRLMGSWGQVWPESGRSPSKTLTYILVSY